MNNKELITKGDAIAAMRKWFYETFDDGLLSQMERHKLIAQAEGFSLSILAEISVEIEAIKSVDP